jgi:hypothetical protein
VRKSFFILLVLSVLIPTCRGEARWCDILGHGDSDKMVYPPIARAARVSGTVLLRVTYTPQGQPQDVNLVSGPLMLAKFAGNQLKTWHLKTNATGEDLCQSLAIIQFRLSDNPPAQAQQEQLASGSMMRLSIDAQMPPCLCDPAPTLGKKRRGLFF